MKGLKDNITFLYKMFNGLRSSGYDVAIVGKAYDDDLYAYVWGDVKNRVIEYDGLHVGVTVISSSIEEFEKNNWYMQSVDGETIREAINKGLAVKDGVAI